MLFRDDTPLTPAERLDYEIERELRRLREEGLVMETIDSSGDSVWAMTLRGAHELHCPGTRFGKVDSNHVQDA